MFYYYAMTPTSDSCSWDDADLAPFPSAEEVALGVELAGLDSLGLEVWESDPPVSEFVPLTDEAVLGRVSGAASGVDLMLLESIDPAGLSSKGAVLDYLKAAERVDAFTAALKARARVVLAGVVSCGELLTEVQVEKELAVATRSSQYAAGMAIERSRVLTSTFPGFLAALAAGEISEGHCKVLVEKTRTCTDTGALAAVGRVTLAKARRMTPGEFATAVAKAVADFDPDAAARYRAAREKRSVWTRELEDGMSYLGMIHDTSTITAIKATLDTDADALRAQRRTPADEVRDAVRDAGGDGPGYGGVAGDAAVWASTDPAVLASAIEDETGTLIGACRADALAARILGTHHTGESGDPVASDAADAADASDGSGSGSGRGSDGIDWTPRPAAVQVQLVIDLATLRGEADRHCLLDGQPIPAQIGRDLAAHATAFRRMVTDPVDGHLLDYGRLTYLPAPLRTYVLARDGGCRAPGCTTRSPRRVQMDHADPFPEGDSSTGNTGGICIPDHQLKTAGLANIGNSHPDGSCDWITAWGQHTHIPARPFLHDPADIPDPDPPPEIHEPPF